MRETQPVPAWRNQIKARKLGAAIIRVYKGGFGWKGGNDVVAESAGSLLMQ